MLIADKIKLRFLFHRSDLLSSKWEKEFIYSLFYFVNNKKVLSISQILKVHEIYEKIRYLYK